MKAPPSEQNTASEQVASGSDTPPPTNGSRKRASALRRSDQRLRLALQAGRMGIWEWDFATNHVRWSPELERIHGYEPGTFPGTFEAYSKEIHPDDFESVQRHIQETIDSGREHHLEYRIIGADGALRWVEGNGSIVLDENGQRAGMIGVCMDITSRKLAEQSLREKEADLELVTQTTPLILVRCTRDLKYRFVNRASAELFKLAPEQMVGRPIVDLMGEESFAKIKPYVDRVLAGESVEYETELDYPIGKRNVHVTYSPDRDERGEVIGWVASIMDITALKRAQEALRENERQFRQMIDSLPAAVYTTDEIGRVTHYNRAAAALAGRTPKVGEDLWCVMWKLYRPDGSPLPFEECPMALTVKSGKAVTGHEIIAERPDGRRAWLAPYPTPIFDETGRIAGGINMVVDITERKRAEQIVAKRATEQTALYRFADRLQRAGSLQEVYESALDTILDALGCQRASILIFDEAAVMRFVGWRGLSDGYRAAVEGHSPWKADEKDPHPFGIEDIAKAELDEALRSVIEGEGIHALAFIPLVSEGKLIGKFMVYYNEPHAFDGDELDLALTIGRQLAFAVERRRAEDERRLAEENLRRLTAELEEKVRLRTADLEGFVYSIAHDMRQQIRGISINATMVSRDAEHLLTPDLKGSLDRLVKASHQLSKLTDEILTHARLGVRDLDRTQVDMSAVADRLVPEIHPRPYCNPATRVQIQPGVKAFADQAMISLVLENLLDNAFKFSSPRLQPCVEFGQDEAGYFVRDNGVGFEPQYAAQVFRAFERLDPAFDGTGIGLANVKRIVERHGGKVWAESQLDAGTTIRFTLGQDASAGADARASGAALL